MSILREKSDAKSIEACNGTKPNLHGRNETHQLIGEFEKLWMENLKNCYIYAIYIEMKWYICYLLYLNWHPMQFLLRMGQKN